MNSKIIYLLTYIFNDIINYGDCMEPIFYKIVKPILKLFIKCYKPTYINKEYIPTNSNYVLAGNHTSYLDPILVGSSTKDVVHFFSKDSLYKGIKKPIFKGLGIIPVNRSIKDKNALNMGINALNNNMVIGIFPEGTINKTNEPIMKFKYGAVKMCYETNKQIVPFAIKNEYKLFKKSVKIIFDKPYYISKNLEYENKKLENKVKKLLKETL